MPTKPKTPQAPETLPADQPIKTPQALAPRVPAMPTVEAVAEGLLFEATLFDKSATQGGRLKAWELLGKHLGMFKDRKDEGEPVVVHFDFTL